MIDELGNESAIRNDIKNLIENHLGKTDNRRIEVSSSASYTTIQTEEIQSETNTSSYIGDTTNEVYKMKAYGKRGRRSPTRIEFFVPNREKLRLHKQNKVKPHKTIVFKKYHCDKCKTVIPPTGLLNYQRLEECERSHKNVQTPNKPSVPSTSFKATVKSKISSTFGGCFEKNDFKLEDKCSETTEHVTDGEKQFETSSASEVDVKKIQKNIEVYYFDHGNAAYFHTTDYPPHIYSEMLAHQTINHATRFWAEIFGSLHIGVAFFISFFMQCYRFLLYSIVRPLIVGVLQLTSDYFIKPLLTIIFNGFLQPLMILFYNIFSSISDMVKPICEMVGDILHPLGQLLSSIRLIDINKIQNVKKYDRPTNNDV